MKSDLIFHIVPGRKWKEWLKNGYYQPKTPESVEKGVYCLDAGQVQEYLNQHYKGRKNLFLLVIDINRLRSPLTRIEKEGIRGPVINGPLNLDAVIDKIVLGANEEGKFDLSIEVKT